jgi:hypothetical protein
MRSLGAIAPRQLSTDPRAKAEMILSHLAAGTGRLPTLAEENAVRRFVGMKEVWEK